MFKKILTLTLLTFLFSFAACEKEGPMERAGEKTDDAIEKTGDKLEKAGDKAEDAVDK